VRHYSWCTLDDLRKQRYHNFAPSIHLCFKPGSAITERRREHFAVRILPLIGLTLFCAASKLISNYSGLLPVTPSSRHNGVTSPISRQFLRRIFEASNVREPASDAALGLVPGGGIYSHHFLGHRENTTNTCKVQY
jgi:hypothetical protein